eukprot:13357651-Alexandrium_andersonii.AAC.1
MSLIALSRSPGRSKFHDWPPGPGRKSSATAGRTPYLGLRSAIAATRGDDRSSHFSGRRPSRKQGTNE